jgi:ribosomal protein L37AE/L43A
VWGVPGRFGAFWGVSGRFGAFWGIKKAKIFKKSAKIVSQKMEHQAKCRKVHETGREH